MYCFYDNGNIISKMEITTCKDEIKDLRNEIIDNCSIITHEEYDSDYEPHINDCFIRNYKQKLIGTKEYFEETRMLYHISYELFTPPHLVSLIDRLLRNEPAALYEIDHYNYQNEKDIDDIINEKSYMCKKIDDKNYSEKIKALKELEKLTQDKKLNSTQISTEGYYYRLLGYIQRENICNIDKNIFSSVLNFFDMNMGVIDGIIVNKKDDTAKQYKKK